MELIYYIFFILSSYIISQFIQTNVTEKKIVFLSLYMAFFLSIRQVPGDNIQYEEAYIGSYLREYELGWALLISFCKDLGFSVVAYKCFAIYFLHLLLFINALKKEWHPYLSLFVLVYCLLGIESSSNIMRHWMAACTILVGYRFYTSDLKKYKSILLYFLCVLVASLFHKSAYIAIVVPLILYFGLPSYKVQCVIFISSFLCGELFMKVWDLASQYLSGDDFVYNFYFNHYEVNKVQTTSGLGQIYYIIETCIIAYMYQKFYNSKSIGHLEIDYYKIYFYGMILFFLTFKFNDMARLALYMTIVQVIILALFLHKGLYYNSKLKAFSIFIIVMRMSLFIRTTLADEISGITPIKFLI